MNRDRFCQIMGNFATGVTIVTTMGPEGPVGLTVNSFTSVSLDPPLVLVCIAKSASSFNAITASDTFGINILESGQQGLSNRFAGKSQSKWNGIDYIEGESGAPLLTNCLATLECAMSDIHIAGDHAIVVGRALTAAHQADKGEALLYYRADYARLEQRICLKAVAQQENI